MFDSFFGFLSDFFSLFLHPVTYIFLPVLSSGTIVLMEAEDILHGTWQSDPLLYLLGYILVEFAFGFILSFFKKPSLQKDISSSFLILISLIPFGTPFMNIYMGYRHGNISGLLRTLVYNGIGMVIILLCLLGKAYMDTLSLYIFG